MGDVSLNQSAGDGVAISIGSGTWVREETNMMTLLSDYHSEERLHSFRSVMYTFFFIFFSNHLGGKTGGNK